MNQPVIAAEVDARGLRCPLPLLKAKQALSRVEPGQAVRVLATDSGSLRDFRTFAELAGHGLTQDEGVEGVYEHILVKS